MKVSRMPKNTGQGKIEPLPGHKEREQAFKDLVETRGMPARR